MNNRSISFFSWNVRGLGQACRRKDVLSELISCRPTFAALQETKLSNLEQRDLSTFLPTRLKNCVTRPSLGASGGILTAWDDRSCSLRDYAEGVYRGEARANRRGVHPLRKPLHQNSHNRNPFNN
ncbi:unnamed protein product [Urochloa humidicola]